jgi:uncharacterized protein YndB with AHSA1/START domain
MSETITKSIIVERDMPHPPEKIWRALTTSALIADWLMENDFAPELGRRFQFRARPMPGWFLTHVQCAVTYPHCL